MKGWEAPVYPLDCLLAPGRLPICYCRANTLCVDHGPLKGDWKGTVMVPTGKDAKNTLVQAMIFICENLSSDNENTRTKKQRSQDDEARLGGWRACSTASRPPVKRSVRFAYSLHERLLAELPEEGLHEVFDPHLQVQPPEERRMFWQI